MEELLEGYAKHKIELALQKSNNPLLLEERIKQSYSTQTPFIIIAPTPREYWRGDRNPFDIEKKFREVGKVEGQTPFFVINNEGDVHWNFYRSQDPEKVIESSGQGLACGAYTFANIIRNSSQFQELELVKELLESFEESYGVDFKTADVNALSPDQVRTFVAQAIEANREKLDGVLYEEEINQLLQRIKANNSMLVSDDLRYAFQVLGIDFYEIANFRNLRGPEAVRVNKELVRNNLLGHAEKSQQYFDEEIEGLRQFLSSRPEIKITTDEVVDFLYRREIEEKSFRNRSAIKSKRAYERDADDSSDDEEVTKKISQYDLRNEWKSFCLSGGVANASDSYQGLNDEEKEQYHLPFLLHSFGTGLLYSNQVNDKYYSRDGAKGLKEKYLYDVRKTGEAKKLVEKNLDKIVARVAELFLPNADKKFQEQIVEHVKKSLSDGQNKSLTEVVDLAVEALVEYVGGKKDQSFINVKRKELRQWQRQNDYYKDNAGNITKCEKFGWKLRDDGVWTLNNESDEWHLEKDGSMTLWQGDNQISKQYGHRVYPRDRGGFNNYNSSTEHDWVRSNFQTHVESLPEKSKKLLQRSFLNHVVKPLEEEGVIEENTILSSAEESPHRIVSGEWYKISEILGKQNLNRSRAALINARRGNALLFEKLLENGQIISAYFQDISDDLQNGGQSKLFRNFIEEVFYNTFLSRKTLPDRYATDNIEDVADFLAEIRLSNRSKIREIKNLKEAPNRKDFLEDDILSRITRFWKFNDGVVAQESQTISSKDLVREAKVTILGVTNEGSYPAICNTINQKIIGKFNQKYPDKNIDDKNIALWIRQKLRGEALDIEYDLDIEKLDVDKINRFVTDFTYLLFGCEVARNPASLVSHQMMLDLIIAEEITWESCLGSQTNSEREMPMASAGAVEEGRAVNALFGKYMPWEYEYPGKKYTAARLIKVDAARLIKAENDLFEQWLKHKEINSQFAEEGLLLACNDWFGIDLQKVIYGSDNKQKLPDNPAQVAVNKWVESVEESGYVMEEKDFQIMNDLLKKYRCKLSEEEKEKLSKVVMNYVYSLESYDSPEFPEEAEFFKLLAKNKLLNFEGMHPNPRLSHTLLEDYILVGADLVAEMMIPYVSLEFLNKHDVLHSACEASNEKICKMLLKRSVEVSDKVRETDFYKENAEIFKKDLLDLAKVSEALLQAEQQEPESQELETKPNTKFSTSQFLKLSRSSSISSSRSGDD